MEYKKILLENTDIDNKVAEATKELQTNAVLKHKGTQAVLDERCRQIFKFGYTAQHDFNSHTPMELMNAAAAYCLMSISGQEEQAKELYPWGEFNPSGNEIEKMVKAGALVLAALDLALCRFDYLNEQL